MGTRSLIVVVKNDEIKVAQYNQYDGYFECTGQLIKEFVQDKEKVNLLNKKLDLCRFLTKNEVDELDERISNGEDIFKNFPQLSRSFGVDVLYYIIDQNEETCLLDKRKFALDSLFCEYAYVVNLDTKTVEFYLGLNTNKNADFGRFKDLENLLSEDEKYRTVALLKTYKFNKIPTMKYLAKLAKRFYEENRLTNMVEYDIINMLKANI